MDYQDQRDHQVNQDLVEHKDPQAKEVLMEDAETPELMEAQDLLDHQDQQVDEDHQVKMDAGDRWEKPVIQDHLVNQDETFMVVQ